MLMSIFVLFYCSLSPSGESAESPDTVSTGGVSEAPPAVIPSQGDLLGDLLNLDLTPPTTTGPPPPTSSMQMGAMDLLGGGLDSLVGVLSNAVATAPLKLPDAKRLLMHLRIILWHTSDFSIGRLFNIKG